jgi:hypothetical protein
MCPGNDESAGKRRSGKTRKGSKWLSQTLVECAKSANRTKTTCLAAQYARLRVRRGAKGGAPGTHSVARATVRPRQDQAPCAQREHEHHNRPGDHERHEEPSADLHQRKAVTLLDAVDAELRATEGRQRQRTRQRCESPVLKAR